MKIDPQSNYEIAEAVSAKQRAAGTVASESVDHRNGDSASFFLSAGTVGTSVDMKIQYSDDDSDWSDYDSTSYVSATSITQLTAAGTAVLHVEQPYKRYSRVYVTTVGTCDLGVISVLGPKRRVYAE